VGDVFGARATLYVGAIATGIAAVAAGVLLLWRYPRLRKRLRRRLRRGRPVKVPTAYETENALN
jgi:hypothetical protein